jgi:hypothetical protein
MKTFNSIVWIHENNINMEGATERFTFFQFHCMDSAALV